MTTCESIVKSMDDIRPRVEELKTAAAKNAAAKELIQIVYPQVKKWFVIYNSITQLEIRANYKTQEIESDFKKVLQDFSKFGMDLIGIIANNEFISDLLSLPKQQLETGVKILDFRIRSLPTAES